MNKKDLKPHFDNDAFKSVRYQRDTNWILSPESDEDALDILNPNDKFSFNLYLI